MRHTFILISAAALLTAGAAVYLLVRPPAPAARPEGALPRPAVSTDPIASPEPAGKKLATLAELDALAEELPLPAGDKTLAEPSAAGKTGISEPDSPAAPVELSEQELEEIYTRAQVFRDEALTAFPVYTVEIHRPSSMDTGYVEENGIRIKKSYGPAPSEIWLRIKPEHAREAGEIMAQTADLYRQYVGSSQGEIRIINWVGGRVQSTVTFNSGGEVVN